MKFDIQEKFFNIILKQIQQDRISHAYLIEVNDFVDIDKFLNILVKLLLCPNKYLTSTCTSCKICDLIDSNSYPDLKIVDTDSNFIKKEQLIDVKEAFFSKSVYNNKQIYIIKDASKLNLSSGNTMLKFLEEPEDNIIAILLTKNRYNVLETILSRCQIFSLESNEKMEFSLDTFDLIKTLFVKDKAFLEYDNVISVMPNKIIAKARLSEISKYLFLIIHKEEELSSDLLYLDESKIYKLILILEKYVNKFEYNLNYKLAIDSLIIEINGVIS